MPARSPPPYSLGHVMPSQPRSASLRMKARRAGVSQIWAMFSRQTSATSGVACSSRNRFTSRTKACSSALSSKSMARNHIRYVAYSKSNPLGGTEIQPDSADRASALSSSGLDVAIEELDQLEEIPVWVPPVADLHVGLGHGIREERNARAVQALELRVDVLHLEAEVADPVVRVRTRTRRGPRQRLLVLEDLEARGAAFEHDHAALRLRRRVRAAEGRVALVPREVERHPEAEGAAVERDGAREGRGRDRGVMDAQEHGEPPASDERRAARRDPVPSRQRRRRNCAFGIRASLRIFARSFGPTRSLS